MSKKQHCCGCDHAVVATAAVSVVEAAATVSHESDADADTATFSCFLLVFVLAAVTAGFIKYALQHGYTLMIGYTFGEELTYFSFTPFVKLRLMLNGEVTHAATIASAAVTILAATNALLSVVAASTSAAAASVFCLSLCVSDYKIPGVAFVSSKAYGLLGFIPNWNIRLISVIGAPLVLPTIAQPTAAEIAFWHQQYITRLQTLFDEHKGKCAAEGEAAKLEIW